MQDRVNLHVPRTWLKAPFANRYTYDNVQSYCRAKIYQGEYHRKDVGEDYRVEGDVKARANVCKPGREGCTAVSRLGIVSTMSNLDAPSVWLSSVALHRADQVCGTV